MERNNKYLTRTNYFKEPYYFEDWLAGFIEAEGSFVNHKNTVSSFSIGQTYDLLLIQGIRHFFKINHLKINTSTTKINIINFYEVSITNLLGLNMVVDHCKGRLQGYKYLQIVEFIYTSKSLKSRINEFVIL